MVYSCTGGVSESGADDGRDFWLYGISHEAGDEAEDRGVRVLVSVSGDVKEKSSVQM